MPVRRDGPTVILGEPALRRAAEAAWDYLRLVHEPAPADLILCMGGHDAAVAARGRRSG